jgi:ABC-2 type transport system permease protein
VSARGVFRCARVEARKLLAQRQCALVLAVCAIAPFAFVAALRTQDGVPSDTLFGRHVHETGFATPLVVLGFAGLWGLPVVAGLAGGDIFASEDRHRTWAAVLTRSRGRAEVFDAKVLVAFLFAALALFVLAAAAVAAGVLLVGTEPLVDLTGVLLPAPAAFAAVALAWASVLPPLLAITAAAILLSVSTRSSVAGVGVPVVAAFVLELCAFADGPEVIRRLLPTTAFDAWHGLLTHPAFYGPIVHGTVVNAVCGAASILIARRIFLRRDEA